MNGSGILFFSRFHIPYVAASRVNVAKKEKKVYAGFGFLVQIQSEQVSLPRFHTEDNVEEYMLLLLSLD